MTKISIDEKMIKRWVEALRSGEYEQGRNKLCKVDKGGARYCCLGVLTELVLGEEAWKADGMDSRFLYVGLTDNEPETSWPPAEVEGALDSLGIDAARLASENDRGADFEAIAIEIQRQLGAGSI